ncbi:MAG: hypothetical protein QXT25_02160 [Candidatus Anstonellaceae archaeon]
MEGLPNIPTNIDSISEKLSAYIEGTLKLPKPQFIIFSWSHLVGEDPHDYHKALIEVWAIKMKNHSVYTVAMGLAYSDSYIFSRRLKEFVGTFTLQSAKYTDPHALEATQIFEGEAFGYLDENLSPTGPGLLGYFSEEPSLLKEATGPSCRALRFSVLR